MKDKERDIFDDLFRSKLQDFEADTMPGDWEAIADRLPGLKNLSLSGGLYAIGGLLLLFLYWL